MREPRGSDQQDYVDRFREYGDCSRMFFICHSPKGRLRQQSVSADGRHADEAGGVDQPVPRPLDRQARRAGDRSDAGEEKLKSADGSRLLRRFHFDENGLGFAQAKHAPRVERITLTDRNEPGIGRHYKVAVGGVDHMHTV